MHEGPEYEERLIYVDCGSIEKWMGSISMFYRWLQHDLPFFVTVAVTNCNTICKTQKKSFLMSCRVSSSAMQNLQRPCLRQLAYGKALTARLPDRNAFQHQLNIVCRGDIQHNNS